MRPTLQQHHQAPGLQPTPPARPQAGDSRLHDLRTPPSATAQLALQTYWAAEGRIWQLRRLADQAGDPEEREVLLDLLMAEHQRQAIARRALVMVWGIVLAREGSGGPP
jgi:hypothetical protein